jgi:hypothetical protein
MAGGLPVAAYNGGVRSKDLVEYALRDRSALASLKAQHWGARKRRLGAWEGLRAAEELRRHVAMLRPDWPSGEDRALDASTHARVGEMLRRVAALGPR